MTGRAPAETLDPVAILAGDQPLKVWSLVVTILGDIVMRQGTDLDPRPIWVGHLIPLLARLGIDEGLARTNLSRVVASGLLERDKAGRHTFYRLEGRTARLFGAFADRLYGRRSPTPGDGFHLALIDRCDDRRVARAAVEAQGFRFLSPGAALRPLHTPEVAPVLPPGGLLGRMGAHEAAAVADELWSLGRLQRGYQGFAEDFSAQRVAPGDALLVRVALVHRMRRLVFRDPLLPEGALPEGWGGPAARKLFLTRLAEVHPASEADLERSGFRTGQVVLQ